MSPSFINAATNAFIGATERVIFNQPRSSRRQIVFQTDLGIQQLRYWAISFGLIGDDRKLIGIDAWHPRLELKVGAADPEATVFLFQSDFGTRLEISVRETRTRERE